MATTYVRSTDGNDADNGSTWALADATLAAGLTAAGAGGRVYVSDAHAESQASAMTLAAPGTLGSPTEVVCGDDAAEPPTAVATTATVATTGNNSMSFTGFAIYRGITFTAGSGGTTADMNIVSTNAMAELVFDRCELSLAGTSTLADLTIGNSAGQVQNSRVTFLDTNLRFGSANGEVVLAGCHWTWRGGTILGTAPTTLITTLTGAGGYRASAAIEGVDLSPLGTGNLVGVATAGSFAIEFRDCKLGSGAVLVTGTWGSRASFVRLVNCASGDTNYKYTLVSYAGRIDDETTIVKDSTLSTDGTTPLTWKMASSADTGFYSPLESDWMAVWCDSTGSKTVTVSVVTDNVTLTDRECWLEVRYAGTSGFPLGLFASDRAADILASAANQTSESPTWTTTGLTTPVKQKLNVTVTIEEKGLIWCRVCLAKASTTVYVDAAPVVT